MKKIILVIYDPSLDSDILRDRIKSLGPNYTFWGNHWFVETTYTTKEVYEKISANEFESNSILVIEMLKDSSQSYYGRMNTTLWDWLKNR
jgi:hypothetical protein